jgi:hypothetical protein
VAVANGCKSRVSCSEDGVAKVWDLTRGLVLANTFWASSVLLVKIRLLARPVAAGAPSRKPPLRLAADVALRAAPDPDYRRRGRRAPSPWAARRGARGRWPCKLSSGVQSWWR